MGSWGRDGEIGSFTVVDVGVSDGVGDRVERSGLVVEVGVRLGKTLLGEGDESC